MPFERYLRDDHTYYHQDHGRAYDIPEGSHPSPHSHLPERIHNYHPHAVQFQIPQFMLDGPPTLAPGGGAEVLPAGLLDSGSDSFASSWFANNGFSFSHSALTSKYSAAGLTFPFNEPQCIPPGFHPNLTSTVDSRRQPLPEPSLSLDATHVASSSSSPGSFNPTPYSLSSALVPDSASPHPVALPSTLSVYSASGFDVISILSRVVNRPNATVQLGPVDLSCSFVIVDVRRFDCPIVYASPTFCHLTGYSEQEVLGRNCRFLQSPTGSVAKGEPRYFVSPEAVSYMQKSLASSKECQTTLVNFRKGGQAFINLVTVIPLRGGVYNTPEEADEVVYHIGFQVDLTEQPNRLLDKLREGCCYNGPWGTSTISGNAGSPGMNHGLGQPAQAQNMTNIGTKGGRHGQMMSIAVSKELRNLIADTTFTDSVPISTGTNMSGPTSASSGSPERCSNRTVPLTMLVTSPSSSTSMNRMSASGNTTTGPVPISLSPSLSLLLLEYLPDFLLVLSLKGAFLYVAPSVRLVLGYQPEDLVGRSISDVCHPADLVPLMRELKEGSVSGLNIAGTSELGSSMTSNLVPKSVDLLFRALPKVLTSSASQTREASVQQGDSQSSQSSTPSSVSPGTQHSDDPSGEAIPPYVWLECRGRLHVEPGKGRKAIILSGRARWMPVVRWNTVRKAGSLGSCQRLGKATFEGSNITAGSRLSEPSPAPGAPLNGPLEFWALLSSQGTFLVASASVRDVLGWGTSEVIGRNIWAMVRDSRHGMRERVEAELAKLDDLEKTVPDPPPTVAMTSLVHRKLYTMPVRLVFYRTPRSGTYAPSSSSKGVPPTPLIHPLNNPLCPIVCQATVLSDVEYQPGDHADTGRASSRASVQFVAGDDDDESLTHPPNASLFEELETSRGTSWQYELQQLKFANQRLQEEVTALEASVSSGSSSNVLGGTSGSFSADYSPSSTTALATPQPPQVPQIHYAPLVHSTLSTSLPTLHPPNSLHEPDPPPSEWSSLAGANGQGISSLKRSWRSKNGPMT